MHMFKTKESRQMWRELDLAKYEDRFRDEVLDAEWGVKTTTSANRIVFELCAYAGSAAKPAIYALYRSPEDRDAALKRWLDGLRAWAIRKRGMRAEKRAANAAPNPAKVGDILRSSWGYDQTNIDYYQVVEIKGKCTIVVRRIGAESTQTGWEQGTCTPRKDAFLDRYSPQTVRVMKHDDGTYCVKVSDCAHASLCGEGDVSRWSSYA